MKREKRLCWHSRKSEKLLRSLLQAWWTTLTPQAQVGSHQLIRKKTIKKKQTKRKLYHNCRWKTGYRFKTCSYPNNSSKANYGSEISTPFRRQGQGRRFKTRIRLEKNTAPGSSVLLRPKSKNSTSAHTTYGADHIRRWPKIMKTASWCK